MTSTTMTSTSTSQKESGYVFEVPLRVVALYFKRRTARRELNAMTAEQLRDVGLDPDVISREHKLPVDPWLTSRLNSLM